MNASGHGDRRAWILASASVPASGEAAHDAPPKSIPVTRHNALSPPSVPATSGLTRHRGATPPRWRRQAPGGGRASSCASAKERPPPIATRMIPGTVVLRDLAAIHRDRAVSRGARPRCGFEAHEYRSPAERFCEPYCAVVEGGGLPVLRALERLIRQPVRFRQSHPPPPICRSGSCQRPAANRLRNPLGHPHSDRRLQCACRGKVSKQTRAVASARRIVTLLQAGAAQGVSWPSREKLSKRRPILIRVRSP